MGERRRQKGEGGRGSRRMDMVMGRETEEPGRWQMNGVVAKRTWVQIERDKRVGRGGKEGGGKRKSRGFGGWRSTLYSTRHITVTRHCSFLKYLLLLLLVLSSQVQELAGGGHQPFYHVLVDMRDRSPPNIATYVAQENIQLLSKGSAGPYIPVAATAASTPAGARATGGGPLSAGPAAAAATAAADGGGYGAIQEQCGIGTEGTVGNASSSSQTGAREKQGSVIREMTSWDQPIWCPYIPEQFSGWVPGEGEGEVGWYVPCTNLYVKYPLL